MKPSQTSYAPFFSLLLFAISALLLFAFAFLIGVSQVFTFVREGRIAAQSTIVLVALGFEGLIILGAAVISYMKLSSKPAAERIMSPSITVSQIMIGVVGTALVLWIGSIIQNNASLNWLLIPILTIPAVVLPIWIILGLGIKNLPFGSRWRTSSIFGISMTLTPFALFVLEILVGLFILIIVIAYALANPDIAAEFQKLSRNFMFLNPESDEALKLIAPILKKPIVVTTILIYFSILVPFVEELLKPLGVWLFAARLDSPAQGFALGALCGAGYTLIETINAGSQVAEWSGLLFTRIGTDLLHITTSALMGGAIVLAWHKRRYLRLFGTYLLAILLHGLWNTSAVSFSIVSALNALDQTSSYVTIRRITVITMIILSFAHLGILVASNHGFRDSLAAEILPENTPTVIIKKDQDL